MRSIALALVLLGACSNVDLELLTGDIVVESDGGDTVEARACFGDSFGCEMSTRKLMLHHDGVATEMTFDGFIFPDYSAVIPIGNALDNYQITDERGRAVILLPPAFDLGPQEERRRVGRADTVRLRWEPAGMPMKWSFEYSCGNGGGWINGGRVDDDEGAVDIDVGDLVDELADSGDTECPGALVLERIRHGSVKNLDARGASGVQRRSVALSVVL